MGHQRLASLPASKNLPEIIGLLLARDVPTTELVNAITKACDAALLRGIEDPAFVEVLWLLVRLPQAAKVADFHEALQAIGISVPTTASSATDIVVGFDAAVEAAQRRSGNGITDLSEIARQSGIAALYSLTQERLPTLWQSSAEDVRTTLATFSAPDKFGELSQRFFADFVARNVHYFLDRVIHQHVGPEKLAQSVGDLAIFDTAVKHHSQESSTIMRAFAKDWLGKNVFSEGKEITRKHIVSFASHASEKIRKELSIRSGSDETV